MGDRNVEVGQKRTNQLGVLVLVECRSGGSSYVIQYLNRDARPDSLTARQLRDWYPEVIEA